MGRGPEGLPAMPEGERRVDNAGAPISSEEQKNNQEACVLEALRGGVGRGDSMERRGWQLERTCRTGEGCAEQGARKAASEGRKGAIA